LAAYVVPKHATLPTPGDLRNFLAKGLPRHRIPSAFVFLNDFPVTLDGGVNRQALLALDYCKRGLKNGFVAPRTRHEKLMAHIWAEILNLKQVGVYDNFFDLGHQSFLAMEIIARVRKTFAVNLSVRALFEDPTVAGMTAAVLLNQCQWTNRPGIGELLSGSDFLPRTSQERLLS
jgi:hypothetical protein